MTLSEKQLIIHEHGVVADERDGAADRRDGAADRRDSVAGERDGVADERAAQDRKHADARLMDIEKADVGRDHVIAALARLVEFGGSDLCLKAGNRPLVRIDGELRPISADDRELRSVDTLKMLHAILPGSRMKEFEEHHEVDFAYSVAGLGRFRADAYLQRGSVSLVFRLVPHVIRSIAELGLPDVVGTLAEEERGLILINGTTGSGKSTTLAAIVEHINERSYKHIVTIEDPIEYLHRDKKSAIDQREVGSDTASFATALRRVMRQDPDIILIGEMRDEITVRTALAAAETGHLVLSTVHALDAGETVGRILDFFPPGQHQQARAMLSGTLKGIISQRLVPRADGNGRVAIAEVLMMTGRVHDMIIDPLRTGELADVISEGDYYGMQTFDQALYKALQTNDVTLEDALRYATRPHDLNLLIQTEGHIHTTMNDVMNQSDEVHRNVGPPVSAYTDYAAAFATERPEFS